VYFSGFKMFRLRSLSKVSRVVNNAAFAGKLMKNIVSATSLNIFENKLDRHLRENWGLK